VVFFQSSAEASFVQGICVHLPTWNFTDYISTFAGGYAISFAEDRIVLGLIVGLKTLRLRCFSFQRIRFKDFPMSA